MNRLARTCAIALTIFACADIVAANAADIPTRKAPPAPAPVYAPPPLFTWTGFYAGLNAGAIFGNTGSTKTIGTPAFIGLGPTLVPSSLDTAGTGFIGGGQIGYNYQIGSIVFGAEADLDYSSLEKSARFTSAATVLGTTLTTDAKSRLDYLGTLRARLGYALYDRLLVFATGGLAYGGVRTSTDVIPNAVPGGLWSGSTSGGKAGYAVGGGAEYALTNYWTVKGEYLYYDLGKRTTSAVGNGVVRGIAALNGVDYISSTRVAGSVVRLGLNYKF